jgi:hypothetical protein
MGKSGRLRRGAWERADDLSFDICHFSFSHWKRKVELKRSSDGIADGNGQNRHGKQ